MWRASDGKKPLFQVNVSAAKAMITILSSPIAKHNKILVGDSEGSVSVYAAKELSKSAQPLSQFKVPETLAQCEGAAWAGAHAGKTRSPGVRSLGLREVQDGGYLCLVGTGHNLIYEVILDSLDKRPAEAPGARLITQGHSAASYGETTKASGGVSCPYMS